jgi:hypothetical protein
VNIVNSVNGVWVLTYRGIHARALGSRYSAEDVDTVINVVSRHGYLDAALFKRKPGPGNRPTPQFEVHPSVFRMPGPTTPAQNSQNSQNPAEVTAVTPITPVCRPRPETSPPHLHSSVPEARKIFRR